MTDTNATAAVVCPDCDAVQTVAGLRSRGRAVCFRCGALLVRAGGGDHQDRALAFTLAAIPMFIAANAFPLIRMEGAGEPTEATVLGAVRALSDQRLPALAALVLLTTIVLPAFQLAASAVLLLWLRRRPTADSPALAPLLRIVRALRPWTQIEILLLGMMVAFGKLGTVFHLTPGIGLPCMVAFALLDRAAGASFAGVPARRREPDSLARTTAFLIAAAVLFVPANLLPVMTTRTLLRQHSDTLLTGVVALWKSGSWPLSIIVFVASVVVPGLKILALAMLVVSTRLHSRWRRGERTRLYRLLEAVGRWSMLDVFVMALLAALLRSQMASVTIHPGAVAFAAVVVLTMLSSMSFDPRLIWARAPGQKGQP